jgi:hypothetical protein
LPAEHNYEHKKSPPHKTWDEAKNSTVPPKFETFVSHSKSLNAANGGLDQKHLCFQPLSAVVSITSSPPRLSAGDRGSLLSCKAWRLHH